MGFRKDAYASVWEIDPKSQTMTKCRISTKGYKNRETGEYEQDFNGFVAFVGTATAARAAKLTRGDRVKLGDVDVTNRYDRDKNATYTNFTVYDFELLEKKQGSPAPGEAEPEGDEDDACPF